MPHRRHPAASSAPRCTFHLGEGSKNPNALQRKSSTMQTTQVLRAQGWPSAKHRQRRGYYPSKHTYMCVEKGRQIFPHSSQRRSHRIRLCYFAPEMLPTGLRSARSVINPTVLQPAPADIPSAANISCLKKCCVCSWSSAHFWVMEQGHTLDFHRLKWE